MPDPSTANGTTTCAGTDANGIRVATPGTTLAVLSGASVSNTGAPAIAVDVPRSSSTSYATNTIDVQGSVSAPGQNATVVSSGAPYANGYYSTQQVMLTVGAKGSVTGTTALALLQSPGNANGTVSATVDNAGTLTGTGGTALLGNVLLTGSGYTSALTSFSSITNRAGARIIGGIVGPVATLTNAGAIDGGAASALDSSLGFSPSVTNAVGATIRSSSAAATILAGPSYYLTVTNAGTIADAGSGAALSGGTLAVANQAGGQISTGGATAITATTSLTLTNAGNVTGNVLTGNGASTVDSTGGTINGSVTFGGGNDTLMARYVGTRALATGITGAINAGGGTNVERVVFAADTDVTTPIDLTAGFQQLVLAPAAKATATLQTGFSTATALVLSGAGTVVNRATIALPTTAVSDLDYAFGSSAAFRNEGSITASFANSFGAAGLRLSNHSFTNTGNVTVSGGTGVSMSYNPVTNSGSITASGTGVDLFDGVLTNSGTIISTASAGVNLYGNVGYTASNSGTIRGATTGAITAVYLTNTGRISSAGLGVAVQPYGYLTNASGGEVDGGSGGAVTVSAFNAGVANAGIINGNVTFNGAGVGNSLVYIALTGGVLNGNLSLTGGAALVTDLINTGPGQFAGITGAVTADSSSTLRYTVNTDAAATLPAGSIGPFVTAGYQLGNGAMLTLTAAAGPTRSQTLLLAGGDKTLTVARGGVLAGAIDLGAGDDSFRLAAGGTLAGGLSGGGGSNAATLDLSAGDLTLGAGALTRFQRLTTEGPGTLTLAGGSFAYDTLTAAGNLTVAADASLAARVAFGAGDNRLAITGGFAGAVDGDAGADSIEVSGGSTTAPVAFASVSGIESYRMTSGFATVSGTAALGNVTLLGGRLVGLAGSRMSASAFTVGQGAIFGSAGTVIGNVAVSGTLSPGASPGTMTVNGNVSLATTSVSVFEITPTVSDKLAVNGAVTIAGGATLQLVPSGALAPGRSLDLITATSGITGSFTTILKPASLFGFVVQDANRIRLLGEFLNDASYTGQVRRSIDYVNGVLTSGQASAALLAAPLLVTASGATNTAAFAQLSPEPYATAHQIGVENGLTLADAARGRAFASNRDTPGVFTFASALSGTRTLEADTAHGTAQATTNGYGFLGGVGMAGASWSLGAFGGYLKYRQSLAGLGARTTTDGAVAGVHGRANYGRLGIKATIAYDGARADTRRALPGGKAFGRYGLHSWIADASVDAALPLAGMWEVRPSIGSTAIRTPRDGVTESGGSAFALTVAARRSTAAFIDGGVTFAGTAMSGGVATVRPYLMIGARYQAEGRTPYALAGLDGGVPGLLATGATRAPVLATATLGADVMLSPGLALSGALSGESGDADHRAAARIGLRLAF